LALEKYVHCQSSHHGWPGKRRLPYLHGPPDLKLSPSCTAWGEPPGVYSLRPV